jgi:hypothetical protein
MIEGIKEEDIKRLLEQKTETKNLDYKECLNWDDPSNKDKLNIVKDILAMSNTQDGGRIIIGVKDETFEFIGVSEKDFKSFNQTKINDYIHKYSDPKITCQVYKEKIKDKCLIIINVSEFQEIPVICEKNGFTSDNKQILKSGQIYIRTDKATTEIISSSENMREFLGRAIAKKGDELLNSIARLIKGKPLKTSDESKENYSQEIIEADKFLEESIGDELQKGGFWEVVVYPTSYDGERFTDQLKIGQVIKEAEVDLRGWNFPHTDRENVFNFMNGRESFTMDNALEGYRAYRCGLFVWKRAFWEDTQRHNGKSVLSFTSTIYAITEFFIFFKRYYENILAEDESLHIEIRLNGTKERNLVSFGVGILHGTYVSKESSVFIKEDIKFVDIRAFYKEIANKFVKQIFLVFNCDDIAEETINMWQKKLIERKL